MAITFMFNKSIKLFDLEVFEFQTAKNLSLIFNSICLKVKVKSLSPARLFATPWTVIYPAPLSMGFSKQEYWSGFPFPSPGDLPNPGIEPGFPTL